MSRRYISCLFLLAMLVGCGDSGPTSTGPTDADVRANNLGVGLMGSFDYGGAFEVFDALVQANPEWTVVRVNLEIARLNRQQVEDESLALKHLVSIANATGDVRARYMSGILQFNSGEIDGARSSFEQVVDADPNDAYAEYYLGQIEQQRGDTQAAIDRYERAMELDPYLRSAIYGASQSARRLGLNERAEELLALFQAMDGNPQSRLAEIKYTRMGPKAMTLVVDAEITSPQMIPEGPLFAASITVEGGALFSKRASCTACDIDGDGDVDVFATGLESGGNLLLLNEDGRLQATSDHVLCGVQQVRAVLWGDVDDDGLLDAYLCRNGINELWRQGDAGWLRSEDSVVGDGAFDTVDGALFDADHDGDLDVFCVNADGPDALINNNRDGSYTRVGEDVFGSGGVGSRQVLIADLDHDRDVDLIVIAKGGNHVYMNDRLWNWRVAGEAFDDFRSADIDAVVSGDLEAVGQQWVYAAGPKGIQLWRDLEGIWSPLQKNDDLLEPLLSRSAWSGLALMDVMGDGALDIIAGDDSGWGVWSADMYTPIFDVPVADLLAWAPVMLHPEHGPSIVSISEHGVHVAGAGPGRFPFAAVQFTGRTDSGQSMRSNASGIGTRVAARVNSRWTATGTLRASAGPGQSLQPLAIGLGDSSSIDFLAIDWSDGVFQTELGVTGGALKTIVETQRQLSSCPIIFAWNGSSMNFVSDCLGVGGVGFRTGRETVAISRPWERFLMPAGSLAARNGAFEIVLAEPMEEVCYLDAVSMEIWDLPPGWFMAIDERMGTGDPSPTGQAMFYRHSAAPRQVTSKAGERVTEAVLAADGVPIDPGALDLRFIGRVLEPHDITIEFEHPISAGDGTPMLLLDGWVEYPYSQTMFAAWQAGATYDPPSVLAQRGDGSWEEVLHHVGYPAGMPRQMVIPLPTLPAGCRRLRVVTDLQVYWDRIQLAWAEPCKEARRSIRMPQEATVFVPGFPDRTTDVWFRPDYDWSHCIPLWDTRAQRGFYTNLAMGGATDLVATEDRSVAIFGTGEAIRILIPDCPEPVEQGWTRHHVLDLAGWCKDMDLANLQGETVGPLPGGPDSSGLNTAKNTRFRSGW